MAFAPAPLRRPRVDRPSTTNNSSIAGGIFGTDPIAHPTPHRTSTDFLSRVEEAEARDNQRQQQPPGLGAYAEVGYEQDRAYERRLQQERGNIVFGDDSSPWNRPTRPAAAPTFNPFQTTNQMQQQAVQKKHEEALQRHEESILMQIMVEQYGMSTKEAKHEIELYHQEQAQARSQGGGRQGTGQPYQQQQQQQQSQPQPPPPPPQQQPQGFHRQHRGQQQIQQQMQQRPQQMQMQMQMQQQQQLCVRDYTAPQQAPQQRSLLSMSPAEQRQYYVQRQMQSSAPRSNEVTFGARRTAQHPGVVRTNESMVNRNVSFVDGGIFAPGVWS